MKLFLDSAQIDEIKHALEVWDVDGITTNPRHIESSGKSMERVLDEIARLVEGTDKPVSVEVNPHLTDWEEMVAHGLELSRVSPNFVIKIGASEAGCQAVRTLAAHGVRTNMTLVFTTTQAWHAARAGATYVSPFLAWKEAHGDEARQLVPEVVRLFAQHGYPTLVLAAALRNARHLAEAALAGAHCATAGFSTYADSFRNPYTDFGHELFGAAWDAAHAKHADVVRRV
jgi:transaldolase